MSDMVLLLDFFPLSSYLNSIEHKAPTHLRIRPLSLQNAGDACVRMGVITLFDWKNSLGARVVEWGRARKIRGIFTRP